MVVKDVPRTAAQTRVLDAAVELFAHHGAEVVIVARRGPIHSAFTLPELIGLTATCDVVLDAADHELVRRDLEAEADALTRHKLEILAKLPDSSAPATRPRIRLAYELTPSRVLGSDKVTGIEFTVTGTDEVRQLDAGLVLTSIGYHGKAIRGLPFDDAAGVVPNDEGRVIDPATGNPVRGSYVAGWIKRGPTGFIGTNKSCAAHTVDRLVADYNASRLREPTAKAGALHQLIRDRRPDVVDMAGWRAIDAAEIARGGADRPRDKFIDVSDMLAAAANAPKPTLRQRLFSW